jgi:hypothetical protein
MLEIEPKNATINNRKILSKRVASVTCNNDLFLNTIALPKYSPILAGVKTPAENP